MPFTICTVVYVVSIALKALEALLTQSLAVVLVSDNLQQLSKNTFTT